MMRNGLATSALVDRTPLHAQLEKAIAARMVSGVYRTDTRIPSEEELGKEFRISRTTVRTAIQSLVSRGLLEIRRGLGTFVAAPEVVQDLTRLSGFVEDMELLGRVASARLLGWEHVPADAAVANRLHVPLGEFVIGIRRVRLADGIALSYDETYLPIDLGEKVVTHDLEAEPIFTLLEQKYGTPLGEAVYELKASVADSTTADALDLLVGAPIFLIERTSYADDGRPVDFERLHYHGERMRFVTRLTRRPAQQVP